MPEPLAFQQARVGQKIKEVEQQFGKAIYDLLEEMNRVRLNGKGELKQPASISSDSLRWMLTWKDSNQVSFEISVIVRIEDDGRQARIAGAWVHRRASTPIQFDGHTPTTKMRKVSQLSVEAIRSAIVAEWP